MLTKLVDLWVTQTNGTRIKTQYPEDKAFAMAEKLSKQSPKSNPMIGYLY